MTSLRHDYAIEAGFSIQQSLGGCSSSTYPVRCGVGSGPGLGPEPESADSPNLVSDVLGTALSARACDDSGFTLGSVGGCVTSLPGFL